MGDRVSAVAAALATAAVAVEVYCDWAYTPDASAKSAAVLEKIMIPGVVVIVHRRMELEDTTCLVSGYIPPPIYTHIDGEHSHAMVYAFVTPLFALLFD